MRPAFVNASTSAPLTGCSAAALHAGGRVSAPAPERLDLTADWWLIATLLSAFFKALPSLRSPSSLPERGDRSNGGTLTSPLSSPHPTAHDDRDQVRVLLRRGPAALAAAYPPVSSTMEVDAQLLPAAGRDDLRARVRGHLDAPIVCLPVGGRRRSSWWCFGRSCSWWDAWDKRKTRCLTSHPPLSC